ncbi:MAG: hypothetical protein ACK5O7_04500 [Holosporales bacterium]
MVRFNVLALAIIAHVGYVQAGIIERDEQAPQKPSIYIDDYGQRYSMTPMAPRKKASAISRRENKPIESAPTQHLPDLPAEGRIGHQRVIYYGGTTFRIQKIINQDTRPLARKAEEISAHEIMNAMVKFFSDLKGASEPVDVDVASSAGHQRATSSYAPIGEADDPMDIVEDHGASSGEISVGDLEAAVDLMQIDVPSAVMGGPRYPQPQYNGQDWKVSPMRARFFPMKDYLRWIVEDGQ